VSIAYPVGDLVLLFGVTAVILRRPAERSTRALGILALSLVLFVIGDVAFGYLSLKGSYAGGDIPDSLYMVAQFLMVVAARCQYRQASLTDAGSTPATGLPRGFSRVPYAAVFVSFGVLILVARHQAVYPLGGLLIGAVGITALVVWRQIATMRENGRLVDELHLLAITDALTGLPNRRHFFDAASLEFYRAQRYGRPLAAIMFDIDHFKRINDGNGHAAGDEVLRAVASAFRSGLRGIDIVARYGGDEFVALLPESETRAALMCAERLRALVRDVRIGSTGVTLSIGVADTTGCGDLGALLARADEALYEAKRAGRDCARAVNVA
jgi:diguanylate cyclase (GGDEF)-like protein